MVVIWRAENLAHCKSFGEVERMVDGLREGVEGELASGLERGLERGASCLQGALTRRHLTLCSVVGGSC